MKRLEPKPAAPNRQRGGNDRPKAPRQAAPAQRTYAYPSHRRQIPQTKFLRSG